MLELWRKRFAVAGFSLHHDDPSVFVRSQWQRKRQPSVYYGVYRIVVTIYVLIAWLLSLADEQDLDDPLAYHLKWPIFLTNWGFTMCTMQAVLCTLMLGTSAVTSRKAAGVVAGGDRWTRRLYKTYWVCFTIAIDLGIAVTVLYWVVIYKPATMHLDYLNIMLHCTNTAVMLVELCVTRHPVRLAHFYVGASSGVAWTIFSLLYHLAGGRSRIGEPCIYPVIDWTRPMPTLLICAGACVFLMVNHCVSFVIYRMRIALAKRLLPAASDENANIQVQETFRGFDNDGMHP